MDNNQDSELVGEFVTESLQSLRDIEQDLLSLESDEGSDRELVNRIFRAVHTIKGNGSYLKLTNLVGVSHRAETLLDQVRCGKRTANSQVTDAILAAVDSLTTMLEDESLGAQHDCSTVLKVLDVALGGDASKDATKKGSEATDSLDLDALRKAWDGKSNVFDVQADIAKLHDVIDTKEGLVAGLSSVGKVLYSSIPLEQMDQTNSGPCRFVYQTILESDLLCGHLELPADAVKKLDLKNSGKAAPAPVAKAAEPKPVQQASAVAQPPRM